METLQGVHHFHGGIGMAALGLLLLLIRVRWRWVAILGLVLGIAGPLVMIDDIYQHSMQRFVQPGYASPCKVLFRTWGVRCPLIKGTVMAADDLFHRLEGTPGK